MKAADSCTSFIWVELVLTTSSTWVALAAKKIKQVNKTCQRENVATCTRANVPKNSKSPFLYFVAISLDHNTHQFFQLCMRLPAQRLLCFGGITDQQIDFSGPIIARIHSHAYSAASLFASLFVNIFAGPFQFHARLAERQLGKLFDGVADTGGQDIVTWRVVLQHTPHALHIFQRIPPVPLRFQISQQHLLLQSVFDARHGAGNLAGHKSLTPARRFVVEQNAVAGKEVVRLAVIDHNPVAVELGHPIGRTRVKRRALALRHFLHLTVEFAGRGLVKPRLQPGFADGIDEAQSADAIHLGGVFRDFERNLDMALRAEVVDLVRFDPVQQTVQIARIGQIAVVQKECFAVYRRVIEQMIDAAGVERTAAPDNAVHGVAFGQQQFGQIGAILAGDAGDEGDFVTSIAHVLCTSDRSGRCRRATGFGVANPIRACASHPEAFAACRRAWSCHRSTRRHSRPPRRSPAPTL